jgi:L-lactate dehydrogenase complex protein LldG
MDIARENILRRVRAALRNPAPPPSRPAAAAVFPPVTDAEARFREEFTALGGELVENLAEFLKQFNTIAADDTELVRKLLGEPRTAIRHCDLAVTGCECLIAQTGSIVVSSRALSALPPTHLVIATRAQLVPDLQHALRLLRQRHHQHWPASLTIITGPSRTADIEKTLVLGAHGPKRLALYFTS